MKLSRRDFIKTNAIAATAAAAGVTIPGVNEALAAGKDTIRWDKAPCRFCGTGCSVLVGTKDGRVVATQGDPDAPVNRGPELHQGLFPVQDHVWQGPSDHAATAQDERQVRQGR